MSSVCLSRIYHLKVLGYDFCFFSREAWEINFEMARQEERTYHLYNPLDELSMLKNRLNQAKKDGR